MQRLVLVNIICTLWSVSLSGTNAFLAPGNSCSSCKQFSSSTSTKEKVIKKHNQISEISKKGIATGVSNRGGSSSDTSSALSAFAISAIWPKSWPLLKDPKGIAEDFPLSSARVAVTVGATYFTWYAQQVGHSNVLASAAVTLCCSMFFDKRLGQAAFCGSFAGMCSNSLVGDTKWALILGVLTSVCFEILIHTKKLFLGVGGRLGATAFIATSIVSAAQQISTGVSTDSIRIPTSFSPILKMMFWHAVGSASTIALREASDESAAADPVRASAVIGLLAALVLKDKAAALGVYGGSFVGMSLPSRLMYGILPGKLKEGAILPTPSAFKLLSAFAIAGCLGGLFHGYTAEIGWWSGAWGGKAGLFAFAGCLLFRGFGKLRALVMQRDVAAELSLS